MLHMVFNVVHPDDSMVPKLISLFTRSAVFHTELLFPDGVAITSYPEDGVHWYHRQGYDRYKWITIPLPWINWEEARMIRKHAETFIGAKYDWLGALFGSLHTSANDPLKWFCSELCAELIRPYTPELRADIWISPDELWRACAATLSETTPKYLKTWKFRYSER